MEENRYKKILKNDTNLLFFILNILLLILVIINSLIESIQSWHTGGFNGLMLFMLPFAPMSYMIMFGFPQIIGTILCIINIKKKSRLLSVVIFIVEIVSLFYTKNCLIDFFGISRDALLNFFFILGVSFIVINIAKTIETYKSSDLNS